MSPATLRLLNWHDYTSHVCLAEFEALTGVRVEEVYADADEDYVRRVVAGEQFDVLMSNDWATAALAAAGKLQPLDLDRLPNWRHVTQPEFRHPPYDPGTDGRKYSSVGFFGAEGFAVRLDKVALPTSSWEMLFDPAYAGQITLIDGVRQALAPALFTIGSDPNTTDQATLDRAVELAIGQRRLVLAYDSVDLKRYIIDGVTLVHCWAGDYAGAVRAGVTEARFILPREGYLLWADAPCIPADARDPANAHRFLDFLMEPRIAALNADHAGYQPVVPAADALIKSLMQRAMRPTAEQLAKGTFPRDLGAFNGAYDEAYARVRGE